MSSKVYTFLKKISINWGTLGVEAELNPSLVTLGFCVFKVIYYTRELQNNERSYILTKYLIRYLAEMMDSFQWVSIWPLIDFLIRCCGCAMNSSLQTAGSM